MSTLAASFGSCLHHLVHAFIMSTLASSFGPCLHHVALLLFLNIALHSFLFYPLCPILGLSTCSKLHPSLCLVHVISELDTNMLEYSCLNTNEFRFSCNDTSTRGSSCLLIPWPLWSVSLWNLLLTPISLLSLPFSSSSFSSFSSFSSSSSSLPSFTFSSSFPSSFILFFLVLPPLSFFPSLSLLIPNYMAPCWWRCACFKSDFLFWNMQENRALCLAILFEGPDLGRSYVNKWS